MNSFALLRSHIVKKLVPLAALALVAVTLPKPAQANAPGGWMVESGCVDIENNTCVHFTHVWVNTGSGEIIVFHFTPGGNWVEYY